MKNTRLCKTTTEQKDDGVAPIVQVQYLSQVKDAVNAAPYGMHTSPMLDTPCLLVTINNDPANSYILPLSMLERQSFGPLKKGEVVLGNFGKNSTILFDETGNISVNSEENITVNGKDVNIIASGNLDATVIGTTILNSTGNVSVTAPNVNITAATNISGATNVTGTLACTGALSAGNGFTGNSLTSVDVLNGIVTNGS